jgi:hypothetical protein
VKISPHPSPDFQGQHCLPRAAKRRSSRQVRPDVLPSVPGSVPDLRKPDPKGVYDREGVAPSDYHIHGEVPKAVDRCVLDDDPSGNRPGSA